MNKKKLTAEEKGKNIAAPEQKKTKEEKARERAIAVACAQDMLQQQPGRGPVIGLSTASPTLRRSHRMKPSTAQAPSTLVVAPSSAKRRRTSMETHQKTTPSITLEDASTSSKVSKSLVRIQFDWQRCNKEKRVMVIVGVIISINGDGSAVILVDPTFFKRKKDFVVNFPNADVGYGSDITGSVSAVVFEGNGFCTFTMKPREKHYIKKIIFETRDPKQGDRVNALIFPREEYITPIGYCKGFVVDLSQASVAETGIFFHNCALHEYTYLGTPLFDWRENYIGMTYVDQGWLHAWSVRRLYDMVLKNKKGRTSGSSTRKFFHQEERLVPPAVAKELLQQVTGEI